MSGVEDSRAEEVEADAHGEQERIAAFRPVSITRVSPYYQESDLSLSH